MKHKINLFKTKAATKANGSYLKCCLFYWYP